MSQGSPALAESAASETPAIIGGRFRVERLLGRGGMGAVYEVNDERTGTKLALKRMLQGKDSKAAVSLFEQEFHVLAGLVRAVGTRATRAAAAEPAVLDAEIPGRVTGLADHG